MGRRASVGRSVLASVSVQAVSLLVGFVVGFVVPRFIDEYQYAYWQTYVLYVGFVGVLHFGLLDGIVLRYSQYDYDELDRPRLRSQFKILLCSTAVIAAAAIAASLLALRGIARSTAVFVSIGIVTRNVVCYNSYLFQITNRIDQYARLVLSQKLGYGAIVVLLLALRVNRFELYCMADLAGDAIGIAVASRANRGLFFGRSISASDALAEWRANVSSGAVLMLANWSGMVLVSGAKMVVQWRWDELTFGKVSFAFSLSNMFLSFAAAVSVVLFPQLKRMDPKRLPEVYGGIRGAMSPMLFAAMLLYYPGCWVLERYLPAYRQSLRYLGILLPMVVYTSKVSLLTNNYLKAYRRERSMLWINVASLAIGMVLFVLSAYGAGSLTMLLCGIVIANMLKSVLSEIAVARVTGLRLEREFAVEAAMTASFILYTRFLSRWAACAAYFITLLAYMALHGRELLKIREMISRKGAR